MMPKRSTTSIDFTEGKTKDAKNQSPSAQQFAPWVPPAYDLFVHWKRPLERDRASVLRQRRTNHLHHCAENDCRECLAKMLQISAPLRSRCWTESELTRLVMGNVPVFELTSGSQASYHSNLELRSEVDNHRKKFTFHLESVMVKELCSSCHSCRFIEPDLKAHV